MILPVINKQSSIFNDKTKDMPTYMRGKNTSKIKGHFFVKGTYLVP